MSLQDIQLSESPILIKLMDGEVGIMVVGYKHHWEVLESGTGQASSLTLSCTKKTSLLYGFPIITI